MFSIMLSNAWVAGINVFGRRGEKGISIYLSHSTTVAFISATSSSITWHRHRSCPRLCGLI
jgi:hypothetical protein